MKRSRTDGEAVDQKNPSANNISLQELALTAPSPIMSFAREPEGGQLRANLKLPEGEPVENRLVCNGRSTTARESSGPPVIVNWRPSLDADASILLSAERLGRRARHCQESSCWCTAGWFTAESITMLQRHGRTL
jgi:hypothetical protein